MYSCFSSYLVPTNSVAPSSVYKAYTTHNSSICSDEGLTLETSAFQSPYGGQFTLSTPLINQIFMCYQTSFTSWIHTMMETHQTSYPSGRVSRPLVWIRLLTHVRALFNWVSKVIMQLLWFCIATLCDWLKNLAALPRPIKGKTKTNLDNSHAFSRFGTGDMYLLRALIGSLDCLRPLWLVRVITLFLVLRHSKENRSNIKVQTISVFQTSNYYF